MRPSFSFFVLGSGGGPFETNLSSYLCKTFDSSWQDGVFAIEAGSGIGMFRQLLLDNPTLLPYFGFEPSSNPTLAALNIFSSIHSYFITHAHLDHIRFNGAQPQVSCYIQARAYFGLFRFLFDFSSDSGLVLSAGTFPKKHRQRIAALSHVLEDIEQVFSGKIWPKLANRNEQDIDDSITYLLTRLQESQYQQFSPNISVCAMPLSHGRSFSHPKQAHQSSAFFIRNDQTKRQFLFLGDVEPDSLSLKPQTIAVWRAAAPLIPHELNSIFLECSWTLDREDALLYGHLSPRHVIAELEALAREITTVNRRSFKRPLRGLKLYVMHCKADMNGDSDTALQIVSQLQTLAQRRKMDLEIIPVVQGMCIGMRCHP